jgi:hypothetical protein
MNMSSDTCNYINVVDAGKHPCEPLLGKILYCEKSSGKSFVARLIKIDGRMLVFETRAGRIILNRYDSLNKISEYVPRECA